MKKIKDQLMDAKQKIITLEEERYSHVVFGALLLLVLFYVIGFFLYNNYDLSQALREKNNDIAYYQKILSLEEKLKEFQSKCAHINYTYKKSEFIEHDGNISCYINGVHLRTIEEVDKALFHFQLGEAKK